MADDEHRARVTQALMFAVGVLAVLGCVWILWHNVLTYSPFR